MLVRRIWYVSLPAGWVLILHGSEWCFSSARMLCGVALVFTAGLAWGRRARGHAATARWRYPSRSRQHRVNRLRACSNAVINSPQKMA